MMCKRTDVPESHKGKHRVVSHAISERAADESRGDDGKGELVHAIHGLWNGWSELMDSIGLEVHQPGSVHISNHR